MSAKNSKQNSELRPCTCQAEGGIPLTQVQLGEKVVVSCLHGEENICQRLREMGFCEDAIVEKITESGALICKVCNTKVAIGKKLAENIIVNSHSHETHQHAVK